MVDERDLVDIEVFHLVVLGVLGLVVNIVRRMRVYEFWMLFRGRYETPRGTVGCEGTLAADSPSPRRSQKSWG